MKISARNVLKGKGQRRSSQEQSIPRSLLLQLPGKPSFRSSQGICGKPGIKGRQRSVCSDQSFQCDGGCGIKYILFDK